MLPETSFIEALNLINTLEIMPVQEKRATLARIAEYYFLNAAKRLDCPFLEKGKCLIYFQRPFTCRAYGLWSKSFYDQQAQLNRQGKETCRAGWKTLGVDLPGEVLNFVQEYCLDVTPEGPVNDDQLKALGDKIAGLSYGLEPYHSMYVQQYFCDFSFMMMSLTFGNRRALLEKVNIVRNFLLKKERITLDRLLEDILRP